jgi:glucose-6-phosphate isomerase
MATAQAISTRPAKGQAWRNLANHFRKIREVHLRQLFVDDPKRGERMTAEAAGLFLDYSKNRITDETIRLLVQLANEGGLRGRIDAMWSHANETAIEHRDTSTTVTGTDR